MWLFTKTGFISIVEHDANYLVVRARDSSSLSALAQNYKMEIRCTPTADYPYRIFLTKAEFKEWLSNQSSEIDYANFKSEVSTSRGKVFASTLLKVWSAMHQVEDKKARSNNEVK